MVAGRKILLLESDAAASFALSSSLRRGGWAVIAGQDAAQAMQLARQQKPDAVVLNARLAGGGGLVALQRLRSSVYTAIIPVICIVDRSRIRDELAAAGAQEMIEPPATTDTINTALSKHLARAQTPIGVPPAVLSDPQRARALKESGLLGSPVDAAFDELMKLTANLLGVPVAMVSVVDDRRQFLKSQIGLNEPWASKRETPLSHSFCQWVVGGNEEVVIPDARVDPVLRDNPAIGDLGVVAYAGIPFNGNHTEAIGSFCAIDTSPREWSESELATLRDLSQVLQSYIAFRSSAGDSASKTEAVCEGIIGATRVLLRERRAGAPERRVLVRIIEEQGHRLAGLTAP